jgi:hypothetical protein
MSMIRCDGCDGLIDTDYNVDGVYETGKPFRYFCEACISGVDGHPMEAEITQAVSDQENGIDRYLNAIKGK